MEKHFYQGKMVATVQLNSHPEGIFANWFVSGPGDLWMIRLLLELQMKVPSSSMEAAMDASASIAKSHIFPLAELSGLSGGIPDFVSVDDNQQREELANSHIEMHTKRENFINSSSILFETAQVYFLAKGFGVKNPVHYVASKLEVPTSTITRRLARSRDEGLIVKQRKVKED